MSVSPSSIPEPSVGPNEAPGPRADAFDERPRSGALSAKARVYGVIESPVGKMFGALVMIVGIGMFALPAGILATGFSSEIRKRDFVVIWKLVAGVPLFTKLDALRISEIVGLLQPKLIPPHYTIVRRDDRADAMYFIVSGEVEVDTPTGIHRLSSGDFFGEIALLKEPTRTATVIAVTKCQLLILGTYDFRKLVEETPEMRETLTRVMEERVAELETGRPGH